MAAVTGASRVAHSMTALRSTPTAVPTPQTGTRRPDGQLDRQWYGGDTDDRYDADRTVDDVRAPRADVVSTFIHRSTTIGPSPLEQPDQSPRNRY